MVEQQGIRVTELADMPALMDLYRQAFPEEDLTALVRTLLEDHDAEVLSLARLVAGQIAGHVVFSSCKTDGQGMGALLGPLAILPEHQKAGHGSALIRAGFERLSAEGVVQVFVLGDPAYYGRFGFTAERGVLGPYPMPEEWADAWQSVGLGGRDHLNAGTLTLPQAWMQPEYWG